MLTEIMMSLFESLFDSPFVFYCLTLALVVLVSGYKIHITHLETFSKGEHLKSSNFTELSKKLNNLESTTTDIQSTLKELSCLIKELPSSSKISKDHSDLMNKVEALNTTTMDIQREMIFIRKSSTIIAKRRNSSAPLLRSNGSGMETQADRSETTTLADDETHSNITNNNTMGRHRSTSTVSVYSSLSLEVPDVNELGNSLYISRSDELVRGINRMDSMSPLSVNAVDSFSPTSPVKSKIISKKTNMMNTYHKMTLPVPKMLSTATVIESLEDITPRW